MNRQHPDYDAAQQGEIATKLEAMYKAARDDWPDEADSVAKVATLMHDLVTQLDVVSGQASDPAAMVDAVVVATDVLNGLVQCADSLNAGAVGIKHVADDFCRTDAYAASWYRKQSAALTHFTPYQAKVPGSIDRNQVAAPGDLGGDPVNPTPVDPSTDLGTRDQQYQTDEGQVVDQTNEGNLGQWEVHAR